MVVLTESMDEKRKEGIFGHTSNFLPVWIPGCFTPNLLVEVDLIENTPDGLIGKKVS